MDRYYFDFIEGMKRSTDREGLEFASAGVAHREAAVTLGQIASEALSINRAPYDAAVEVRDVEGTLLYHASLSFRPNHVAEQSPVDRATRLATIERHIERAEHLIDRQRTMVRSLAHRALPTGTAVALLNQFEGALHSYRTHLERVRTQQRSGAGGPPRAVSPR